MRLLVGIAYDYVCTMHNAHNDYRLTMYLRTYCET